MKKTILIFLSAISFTSIAQTVTLNPVQSAVIYEPKPDHTKGDPTFFPIGKSNMGTVKRALMKFDIAGNVPAGATIDSVKLSFTYKKGSLPNVDPTINLHPMLSNFNWIAGLGGAPQVGIAANPGEVTWNSAAHGNIAWSSPGGGAGVDFTTFPTASTVISGYGNYAWTGMKTEVQTWLDNPTMNGGWMIKSDEITSGTAFRLDNVDTDSTSVPKLLIYYKLSTSMDENSIETNVEVYPNPTNGTVNIELDGLNNFSLKVFNRYGQIVRDINNVTSSNYQLHLNGPAGIYYATVTHQNKMKTINIIKK